MSNVTKASDLLTKKFLRISTQHTLGEMLSIVLYGEQRKHDTGAIVLIDDDAEFAGILTHNTLAMALAPSEAELNGNSTNERVFQTIQERMNLHVTDFVEREDWPAVRMDTPLAELAKLISDCELECLPVIEEGRVEGLVYLSDVFSAAAGVALTPETEGISLDR